MTRHLTAPGAGSPCESVVAWYCPKQVDNSLGFSTQWAGLTSLVDGSMCADVRCTYCTYIIVYINTSALNLGGHWLAPRPVLAPPPIPLSCLFFLFSCAQQELGRETINSEKSPR